LTKRNLTLGRLWNHEIFMEYRWFQSWRINRNIPKTIYF
jgi:hypothetical protein